MDDPDAIPIVNFAYAHWNLFNIPADARALPEGASNNSLLPAGTLAGTNHDGVQRYSGPCAPTGAGLHHYVFALYALSRSTLPVNPKTPYSRSDFEREFQGDILQKVELIGTYTR
jgi:Raf kinase inhibitor-like YbhB/YbcL family protein